MAALAQGQTSDASNPQLVFFAVDVHGHLVDLESLEFQIFSVADEDARLAPVQVFPATPGQKHTVNLSESGPDRLGLGRYVATYTVDVDEDPGLHEIRWFWQFNAGDPVKVVRKPFEVVTKGAGPLEMSGPLGFIADLREEGIKASGSGSISDARLQVILVLVTRFIESVTGRRFGPHYETQRLSGTGARVLLLGDPIIGIESTDVDTTPYSEADLAIDPSLYRVFNRHLGGMTNPDDRENPKLEFVHSDDLLGIGIHQNISINLRSLIWPDGVQNCQLVGVFGYTEADGSPWGEVPALIRQAVKLIMLREMVRLHDIDCREEWRRRWQLTSERTRDQSYNLANPRSWGGMTGDPEIDMILMLFMRPPAFGAA